MSWPNVFFRDVQFRSQFDRAQPRAQHAMNLLSIFNGNMPRREWFDVSRALMFRIFLDFNSDDDLAWCHS